jgi:hypothetical protein
MNLDDAKLCTTHGFQRERGFAVDETVAEIVVPVIRCHSSEHPEPRERIVIVTPDGKVRVHDYATVCRAHGHQAVSDRWMLGRVGLSRVVEWVRRQVRALEPRAVTALLKVLRQR